MPNALRETVPDGAAVIVEAPPVKSTGVLPMFVNSMNSPLLPLYIHSVIRTLAPTADTPARFGRDPLRLTTSLHSPFYALPGTASTQRTGRPAAVDFCFV